MPDETYRPQTELQNPQGKSIEALLADTEPSSIPRLAIEIVDEAVASAVDDKDYKALTAIEYYLARSGSVFHEITGEGLEERAPKDDLKAVVRILERLKTLLDGGPEADTELRSTLFQAHALRHLIEWAPILAATIFYYDSLPPPTYAGDRHPSDLLKAFPIGHLKDAEHVLPLLSLVTTAFRSSPRFLPDVSTRSATDLRTAQITQDIQDRLISSGFSEGTAFPDYFLTVFSHGWPAYAAEIPGEITAREAQIAISKIKRHHTSHEVTEMSLALQILEAILATGPHRELLRGSKETPAIIRSRTIEAIRFLAEGTVEPAMALLFSGSMLRQIIALDPYLFIAYDAYTPQLIDFAVRQTRGIARRLAQQSGTLIAETEIAISIQRDAMILAKATENTRLFPTRAIPHQAAAILLLDISAGIVRDVLSGRLPPETLLSRTGPAIPLGIETAPTLGRLYARLAILDLLADGNPGPLMARATLLNNGVLREIPTGESLSWHERWHTVHRSITQDIPEGFMTALRRNDLRAATPLVYQMSMLAELLRNDPLIRYCPEFQDCALGKLLHRSMIAILASASARKMELALGISTLPEAV